MNLNHPDWRLRVVSYECLDTWGKEGKLEMDKLPDLTIRDKLRKKIYRNFEVKLLAP